MSTTKKFNAVTAATDFSDKSVLLTDAAGNVSKMDYLDMKCTLLFRAQKHKDSPVFISYHAEKSFAELKGWLRMATDSWGAIQNIPEGEIVIIKTKCKETGTWAYFYNISLGVKGVNGTELRPLLLEIQGLPLMWNDNIEI